MQKNFNMMYISLFFFPFVGALCFDNLLFLWLLMELQMMAYVVILSLKSKKTNYVMFFLIIQMLVGVLSFVLCFMSTLYMSEQVLISYFLIVILFMKMGMYPFASWALKFISSIKGVDLLVFLTIMKIIPLVLCVTLADKMLVVLLFMNWVFSSLVLSSYTSYKKVIFFSSISNTALLLLIFFLGNLFISKIFLLFYFLSISILIFYLEKSSCEFIFSGKKSDSSILLFIMIFSMVGLPFLWGFSNKLLLMFSMSMHMVFFFFISLFIISFIFSFFYMKLILFFFMSNNEWFSFTSFISCNESRLFMYTTMVAFPLMSFSFFLGGLTFFV